MGSIPLPALHVNPPQPQADPIEQYGRIVQLRNMMQNQPLQNQALQQQVQLGGLQVQGAQQDLATRQALQTAYQGAITKDANGKTQFDSDKLIQNLAQGPAAYKTPEVMEGITKFQQGRIALQTAAADLQSKTADMIGGAAAAIKAANYDPTLAHSLLDSLPPSPQLQAMRPQIDNPQALRQMVDTAIANSAKQRELGAQETTANARKQTSQAEADKLAASQNPQSSLYAPSQAAVAMGTAPGAAQIQTGEVKQAARKAGAEESARMPGEMALAKARQVIQDGDPKSAAQLLINGDVAPSQLISSRKPEFAQQAFQMAHDLSGGQWNAQSAEANFKVANSPENVKFFGSAKSLTDPGGTLEQLAQTGKTLPQNQIPAFNSIADWTKAATGSGPIAKYAAQVVGVADDYAKVMGGGTGTDTSRDQVAKLIGAAKSPEQRQAAIDGIRGSVASQINSRIGNNSVLQRMYGNGSQQSAPASGGIKVGDQIKLKSGKTITVKAVHPDGSFD
jgi:hypothetical protein